MSKRCAAELLGTFWLVFGGCGSAVLAAAFPEVGIGLLGVSLAFGLTVVTMAYAVGHISGGHFNPAITVGALVAGRIGQRRGPVHHFPVTAPARSMAARHDCQWQRHRRGGCWTGFQWFRRSFAGQI